MAGPWEAYQKAAPEGPWSAYQESPKSTDERTPEIGLGYAADLAMGARQALDAGAQLLARGVEGLMPAGSRAEAAVRGSRESLERDTGENFANYKALTLPEQRAGAEFVRGGGQALITAPLTPAMRVKSILAGLGLGAGVGAGSGALTPVYDAQDGFWGKKGEQMTEGAVAGAALGGAGVLAGKALDPAIDAGQKLLQRSGVRLTPGQALGGVAKAVEDRLSTFPLIGDLINSRRVTGILDFNRAVYSKAVEPFGAEGAAVVKAAKPGHEGIRAVGDFLSNKYEDALRRSVPSVLDHEFRGGVAEVAEMVPGTMRDEFLSIVKREVTSKIMPGGTLTPSVAKRAESELGRLAAGYRGSANFDQRELGAALRQAQSELRGLVARNNPEVAPMIRAADEGWRTLVQMENAGAMVGARDGIFTPAQFLNAVKKSDKSLRDRAFARGEAWNQQLADAAKDILPNQVPNSGTPERLLTGLALGGGLDFVVPGSGIAAGTVGAAYLPGVNQMITRLLTAERPQAVKTLGELARRGAPYAALGSGAAFADE